MSVPGDRTVRIAQDPHALMDSALPIPDPSLPRYERLRALFEEAGCGEVELRELKSSQRPLLLCALPGLSPTTILVSTSYDAPRSADADGWPAAAMLPNLYRALAAEPRRHTYLFLAFGHESRDSASPAATRLALKALGDEAREPVTALVDLRSRGLRQLRMLRQADPELQLDLRSVSRSLEVPMRRVEFTTTELRQAGFALDPRFSVAKTVQVPVVPSNFDIPTMLIVLADSQIGEYLESFRLISAYLAYLDQTLAERAERRAAADDSAPGS